MGILIPHAILSSGIPVSNIYACISCNGISVWKDHLTSTFNFNGSYRIYSSADKNLKPIDNLQIHYKSNTMPNESLYTTFYDHLKLEYPGSSDVL
jgi:hypothetical protein